MFCTQNANLCWHYTIRISGRLHEYSEVIIYVKYWQLEWVRLLLVPATVFTIRSSVGKCWHWQITLLRFLVAVLLLIHVHVRIYLGLCPCMVNVIYNTLFSNLCQFQVLIADNVFFFFPLQPMDPLSTNSTLPTIYSAPYTSYHPDVASKTQPLHQFCLPRR